MAKKRRKDKPSLFGRILGGIERAGNRLPHPITLFALFTLGIILVSALCALLGVSATGELINSKTLELETQTVTAVSLLSKEGVVYMLTPWGWCWSPCWASAVRRAAAICPLC